MADSSVIKIAGRDIGAGHPCFVIAEIGINHEGSADQCARMIEAAAHAGADSVKLQIIDAKENYAPGTESYALFSGAWLEPSAVAELFVLARRLGVEPFATVGDAATLAWVNKLNPAAHKISSGLLTHHPMIAAAARTGKPLIISTGMSETSEIDAALVVASKAGANGVSLLHCTSIYPAPLNGLHLAAIPALSKRTGLPVGFSDHSLGEEAAPLSVAFGAVIVEKHFTLDTKRPSYDHGISLDPAGFSRMAAAIRRVEDMRGAASKPLTEAERLAGHRNHRFLAARRDIAAGSILREEDIGFFRMPPDLPRGFKPSEIEKIIGRQTRRSLSAYTPLLSQDLVED